jgi:2',3'-cyclic-nucleotide 2'-phosphodiesterase / 3'-nucleotidase
MSLCGDFVKDLGPIAEGSTRVHLRILATSDLHSHLLPYDYFNGQRDDNTGLVRVAGLIEAARSEVPNCILLDNGDTLQGAPLGDFAVSELLPRSRPHPMIATMNALGYEAGTLGNHDFDYGLPALETMLSAARFPVVIANAVGVCGREFRQRHVILERSVIDRGGRRETLRIGITGVVPPQVSRWNRIVLDGALDFTDPLLAAAREAALMRAQGADLVVVLSHGGLEDPGTEPDPAGAENAARAIAALNDVDAVVAGHTHEVQAHDGDRDITGRSAPIVQPGYGGSHLGCIDLAIERPFARGSDRKGWRVVKARAKAIPVQGAEHGGGTGLRRVLRALPDLRRQVSEQHRATRRFTERQLGETAIPLTTYFSYIAPCAATQLVAEAQVVAGRAAVATDAALSRLRILSAVAPFRCGGRAGPNHYTDIPAGPLRLRHAHDLYCYPNLLAILRVRGRDLRCWLERAASIYRRIDPDDPGPQPLVDAAFASYNFDRIEGLSYEIDVSRPARTNATGDRLFETEGRVRDLRYEDGTPVDPGDEVLVVTSTYRAAGGGHFRACLAAETVLTGTHPMRDHVARYISEAATALVPLPKPTFRLAGLGRAEAIFETGQGALRHPGKLEELGLEPRGEGEGGFMRFALRA